MIFFVVAVFLFFLLKGGNNNSDVTPENTEDSQVYDGVAAVSMFISPYILFVSLYFSLVYFFLSFLWLSSWYCREFVYWLFRVQFLRDLWGDWPSCLYGHWSVSDELISSLLQCLQCSQCVSHLTLCLPSMYFSLFFIDRLGISQLIDKFFFVLFCFVLLQNGGTKNTENTVDAQEMMV